MIRQTITLGRILKQNRKSKSTIRLRGLCRLFARFSRSKGGCASIPVDLLLEKKSAFWRFLRTRSSSNWDFRKYSEHIPFIFSEAKRLGWKPDGGLSDKWCSVLQEAKDTNCAELVRYCARQHLEPQDITHEMVTCWADQRVIENESSFVSANDTSISFETLLKRHGYTNVNPIAAIRSQPYRIPLSEFPAVLQKEVKELLKYRTEAPETWDADFEDDDNWEVEEDECDNVEVSRRRQLRNPTATGLEDMICRFYGYQITFAKRKDVHSLKKFFRVKAFEEYAKWLVKERCIPSAAVLHHCQPLISSAMQYPPLASSRELYLNFRQQLEKEKLSAEKRRRRERACLSYDTLKAIPKKIRAERLAIGRKRPSISPNSVWSSNRIARESARLAMRELLMRWLLLLPWPSRNLCEFRIGGDNPNLFKRQIVDRTRFPVLPKWAAKLRAKNSNVELWQFHFSSEETSNKQEIHDLLPRELIEPLVAYIAPHGPRSVLVGKRKVNTFFINDRFGQVRQQTMQQIITELTLRHGGKRVSPQSVRDIWAFEYLECDADDYEGLALHLWQSDSMGTRKLYGPIDDSPPKKIGFGGR